MKHQAMIQPRMETYRMLLKQNTFLSGAAEECLKQLCAPEDQIYVTLWAPALVQYVAWVLEEAQKNRQKRLYFLARDAYPMYLVAKKMVEYLHIPIEICYLRVSRYALRIPEYHLLGDACLDRIFLSGIDISFYQILNRAALSEEEMIAVCREINYQRSLHATLNRKEIFNLRERVKKCCAEGTTHLLHGSEYPEIAEIVNAIIREEKKQSPYYRQVITSYLHALVYEMFRLNEVQTQTRLEAAGSGTMRQIADALTFVNDHYQEEVKVCTLAQVCGMSETSFRKVFEEYVHMLPMDYVNLVRVQYACQQMKHGNDSMDEVARKAGFSTTSTFNRNFKKFFNTSPYQWKINPQRYERKLQNFHINALKGW